MRLCWLVLIAVTGYVSWGFRNPSTTKEKLLKTLAQNTIYSLGEQQQQQQPYAVGAAATGGDGKGESNCRGNSDHAAATTAAMHAAVATTCMAAVVAAARS